MKVIIDREDIINHFAAKLGVCNSEKIGRAHV